MNARVDVARVIARCTRPNPFPGRVADVHTREAGVRASERPPRALRICARLTSGALAPISGASGRDPKPIARSTPARRCPKRPSTRPSTAVDSRASRALVSRAPPRPWRTPPRLASTTPRDRVSVPRRRLLDRLSSSSTPRPLTFLRPPLPSSRVAFARASSPSFLRPDPRPPVPRTRETASIAR